MDIKEKIKTLPSSPGVYLMRDSLGNIIYVGKSKNLKNRVSSYFQKSKTKPPKVVKLVKNLKDFEYILTDTEFEAFLLECKLIQELKPTYNRQMKNPNSYTYIKIKKDEKYSAIEISSEININDGNIYFGPYTNKNTASRGIDVIREYFKVPCCSNFRKSSSCLNYSMGLCIGMCKDDDGKQKYIDNLDKIIKLLQGKDKSVIFEMQQKMFSCSKGFDFENAAKYRDYIKSVKYLISRNKVVKFAKENKNIVLIEYLNPDTFKFFLIRGNEILYSEKYVVENFHQLKITLKSYILLCFKDRTVEKTKNIEKATIDESQIIYSYLKNKSNNCKYAVIFKKWLHDPKDTKIDNAITKLLSGID
ncbi:MAG: putative endonuclease [Clostridiaceae bacterium]|jgi:excinuclease ABC subunit C|nr:putative endonuclease [Clostridiaceae bacterium]